MRTKTTTALVAGAALLLTLTACEEDGRTGADKPGDARPAAPPTTTPPRSTPGEAEEGTLPDMTGKGLQSAQDQAQAAGFHDLRSHDALGRGRVQALDRNWKVCGQTPAAGVHPTDVRIDFAAVKLEEECPAEDQGAARPETATTMPDFTGKSVKVARQALDPSTGLLVTDASSRGRVVLVESNWQVCTQKPAAGTPLDGRPVTLTAVKFGEAC
ncbi:PASTA domain-containing protein [Streptomyces sp. NPDC035033]|uniref:PASTA domain-containing protein n=1 Tax=Streptomyces sp. NPDC035033 TaxID=3155368 RepID=UPI0033FC1548